MLGMSISYSITFFLLNHSVPLQVIKRRVRFALDFLSLTCVVRDVLRQSPALPPGATAEVVAHPNSKQAKANCGLQRQLGIPMLRLFQIGMACEHCWLSRSGPNRHSSPLPPSSRVSASWPISPQNPWITKNARSLQFHRKIGSI